MNPFLLKTIDSQTEFALWFRDVLKKEDQSISNIHIGFHRLLESKSFEENLPLNRTMPQRTMSKIHNLFSQDFAYVNSTVKPVHLLDISKPLEIADYWSKDLNISSGQALTLVLIYIHKLFEIVDQKIQQFKLGELSYEDEEILLIHLIGISTYVDLIHQNEL